MAMATLGHVAVGLAAARLSTGPTIPTARLLLARIGLALLALAPDADVVSFAFGIPYAATWGHRGAGHSLTMALAVGVVAGIVAHHFKRGHAVRVGLVVMFVVTSHGLLDIFTDGGLGMALFWPFTNERFFAPWRPIPVAPIGLEFLSGRGLLVLLVEAGYFAPLLAVAFWPRRRPKRIDPGGAPPEARDGSDEEPDDGADAAPLPIDGILDLHTFRPRDVKTLLPDYLAECRKRGILEVRIIHGKGTGALRRTVEAVLKRLPEVVEFRLANGAAGGWGAILVTLRPQTPGDRAEGAAT